jgi:hypothetical protein
MGIHVLVPGFALLLTAIVLLRTAWRQLRPLRRPRAARSLQDLRAVALSRFPVLAIPRRLLPWLLLALGAMVATVVLLALGVEGEVAALPPTLADVGLLPANPVAAAAVVLLAALGALRLLVSAGLHIGRRRRVTADAVLLISVVALILQRLLGEQTTDALPAAPALAVLMAEGTALALLLGRTWLARARRCGG